MLPLILAAGAGARSRFSIGLTIFAGMSIGTLFTLFVTPAVYTFVARDHRAGHGGHATPAAPHAPIQAPPKLAEARAAAE
jgi:AcrB/AcrD/AcrF family